MIYVYIKTHNITGLMYFGITHKEDVHKYRGSGKYWKNHIKKHGYDVTTSLVFQTGSQEEATLFCEEFSTLRNIVQSDEWANLIVENGFTGNPKGIIFSEEHRKKLSEKLLGNQWNRGKSLSEETRQKMGQSRIGNQNRRGVPHSDETKAKMSAARKGKSRGPYNKVKEIACEQES